MYIVKKQLDSFSAAHRLVKGYQGKCKDLHGHDYLPEVTLVCETLDDTGFVIDFTDIKRICNNWIQDNWDHATLLSHADPELLAFLQAGHQRYFLLADNVNSTVENLAAALFAQFQIALHEFSPRVTLQAVTICESATVISSFTADNFDN